MQIVSCGDNLHEISKPIIWENKKKIFQNVVCWNIYPACRELMIRTGKNRLAFPISEQKRKVMNLNILDRHLYKPYIIIKK